MAVGFMLYLTGRDATSSLDAISVVATNLREEGVEGSSLDRDLARQMIAAMDDLVVSPETIPEHVEELKTVAATAASWAQGALAPSAELRAAVSLRKAAGELRAQALSPSTAHLMRARRYLRAANDALNSTGAGANAPGPGLATDAIRDKLENAEQAQREKYQELDEELDQRPQTD